MILYCIHTALNSLQVLFMAFCQNPLSCSFELEVLGLFYHRNFKFMVLAIPDIVQILNSIEKINIWYTSKWSDWEKIKEHKSWYLSCTYIYKKLSRSVFYEFCILEKTTISILAWVLHVIMTFMGFSEWKKERRKTRKTTQTYICMLCLIRKRWSTVWI